MNVSMLQDWRVMLGVCGGIAAYKAAELVRRLREAGADVRVVLTENAARFVTPLTFQALSHHPVRMSLWDEAAEAAMSHIELARWAQLLLIAPASADMLAKLAQGRADDLLSTVCLASAAKVMVAPAMNQQMWAHPATQYNLKTLSERGVAVIGPAIGEQACGDVGPGRLLEPEEIIAAVIAGRGPRRLERKSVLVSAGPTFEDIDPVRFIGNRSSGRMGFAMAQAAVEQGAAVTLIAGPVSLPTPSGVVSRINVRNSADMRSAIMQHVDKSHIFISAAAVSDYQPVQAAAQKLKKTGAALNLILTQCPDILADVAGLPKRPFLVGFAAETEALEDHARAKLANKKLDMIAANPVGAGRGFEVEHNELHVFWPGGGVHLPATSKLALARSLTQLIAERSGAMCKSFI